MKLKIVILSFLVSFLFGCSWIIPEVKQQNPKAAGQRELASSAKGVAKKREFHFDVLLLTKQSRPSVWTGITADGQRINFRLKGIKTIGSGSMLSDFSSRYRSRPSVLRYAKKEGGYFIGWLISDGVLLNEQMVVEGLASVDDDFQGNRLERLKKAEEIAKANLTGGWKAIVKREKSNAINRKLGFCKDEREKVRSQIKIQAINGDEEGFAESQKRLAACDLNQMVEFYDGYKATLTKLGSLASQIDGNYPKFNGFGCVLPNDSSTLFLTRATVEEVVRANGRSAYFLHFLCGGGVVPVGQWPSWAVNEPVWLVARVEGGAELLPECGCGKPEYTDEIRPVKILSLDYSRRWH